MERPEFVKITLISDEQLKCALCNETIKTGAVYLRVNDKYDTVDYARCSNCHDKKL